MKYISFVIGSLLVNLAVANGTKKYTLEEYVETWKSTAVSQMIQFKIPASITMAQGILESGNGNSLLAQQANNHFGIKCHDWTGEKMYIDDDKKNECFRSYSSADESFADHSKFLTGRTRYASLFTLSITDYEAWAKGLKEAGYATNPKYPDLLIDLIKRLKLDDLDKLGTETANPTDLLTKNSASKSEAKQVTRTVLVHKNNVKYVVAKKGDTFYRISKELGISLWQLYRYNDFGDKKDVLVEGDLIYIQPKRRKSKSTPVFAVETPITLRQIAQLEGVKLESLIDKNNISSPDEVLSKGQKVTLK